jgi:hypothetical protein
VFADGTLAGVRYPQRMTLARIEPHSTATSIVSAPQFRRESNIEQMQLEVLSKVDHSKSQRRFSMMHKGVHYTVAVTAVPSIWEWQFRIGDAVKTGKTETRINLLAIRRVQLRIDRELKKTMDSPTP